VNRLQQLFPHYYAPTEDELAQVWGTATFTFDASALLNLYAYSPETRQEVFAALTKVQERLWLPHQAAEEYQRNRLRVIAEQYNKQIEIDRIIFDAQKQALATDKTKSFDFFAHRRQIEQAFMAAHQSLAVLRPVRWSYLEADPLRDQIATLFGDHIGEPYDDSRLKQIHDEGRDRYNKRIPPGFMDQDKNSARRYGDLILWFQLIDHGCATTRPVIFITDDIKSDWWIGHNGAGYLPLPKLVEEMHQKANVAFHLFTTSGFFFQAQRHEMQIARRALEEIEASLRVREAHQRQEIEQIEAGGPLGEYLSLKYIAEGMRKSEPEDGSISTGMFGQYVMTRLAELEQQLAADGTVIYKDILEDETTAEDSQDA
jgi:hypothetical protein